MANDPRLDQIIEALGALTTVVGSLAETVARQTAYVPTGGPAAPPPVALVQDEGYSPLLPLDSANKSGRLVLAHELGVLGTPAGDALLAGGARGFYRGLLREEAALAIQMPRACALKLIEEAVAEDSREGIEMSHDLLKVWDTGEPPVPGVDRPTVSVDKHGVHS